ncbi:hypothetical protein HGA88_02280 [Candidatus Roizmanbacteria bacterium]|nr:hypothetical protein [Candidatus Roizmanbacteria bacterium]
MKNKNVIPKFKNEGEEREFWATHNTTEYFDVRKPVHMEFPNLKLSTETISIRLPVSLLEDIKSEARKMNVPYQSLMKIYIADRVKDEQKKSAYGTKKTSYNKKKKVYK